MRYEVRVQNPEMYDRVAALLRGQAKVLLELPRRNVLAVEGLGAAVRNEVVALGAIVEPDLRHTGDPVQ